MAQEELAHRIGKAWENLPEPRPPFSLEIISPGRPSVYVNLGPHPPRLWPEDIDRVHELWLQLSRSTGRGCITAILSASLCAAWNVSWRTRNSRWISRATSSIR